MTTQNATSISRKRSSPAVSCPDLQKLRIQTWYKHLLERAVEDEVTRYADIAARRAAFGSEEVLPDLNMALQKWLNDQVQKNLHRLTLEESELVLRLRRSRYDEGKSTPTAMTIRLCELLLEGSAAVYDDGPGNLPLWRVLDGDLKACKAYVQDMLNPSPERWDQSFDEIVQEVFDALIAPAYRLALDAIPVLGVPQWWAENQNFSFYDDTMVFRPARAALACALVVLRAWPSPLAKPQRPCGVARWMTRRGFPCRTPQARQPHAS